MVPLPKSAFSTLPDCRVTGSDWAKRGWGNPEHATERPTHVSRIRKTRRVGSLRERGAGSDRRARSLQLEPRKIGPDRYADRCREGMHQAARRQAHSAGERIERPVPVAGPGSKNPEQLA